MAEKKNAQKEEITRRINLSKNHHPRYVVWELTLGCDQRCLHCGSRAGDERAKELPLEKALDVARELIEAGTKDVVLIGGEAYLYEGFLAISKLLAASSVHVSIVSGGRGLTTPLLKKMADAGIKLVSVSIDGLRESHDIIRANRGSFDRALKSLDYINEAGLKASSNININKINAGDLEALYQLLKERSIVSWQVQITTPLGRAADRPDMILQPFDLLDLMPRIASLKKQAFKDGITLMPGNNLGYFGPEETLLRSPYEGGLDHYQGCQAGKFLMGIESDGKVKGCPSLQTGDYADDSVKNKTIDEIWHGNGNIHKLRSRTIKDLWGFCRTCPFAEPCMGGCSFTSHALFGRPGNNPYCHYRAQTLKKRGQRERLSRVKPAAGKPFDNGIYEIILEDWQDSGPLPLSPLSKRKLAQKKE